MPMTSAKKASAIKHILENIFALDPNSKISKALKWNEIISPFDLVSVSDKDIQLLTHKEGDQFLTLSKGHVGKLTAFSAFIVHRHLNKNPIEDEDWEKLIEDEFNEFRTSPDFKCWQLNGPPVTTKTVYPVCKFKKGI